MKKSFLLLLTSLLLTGCNFDTLIPNNNAPEDNPSSDNVTQSEGEPTEPLEPSDPVDPIDPVEPVEPVEPPTPEVDENHPNDIIDENLSKKADQYSLFFNHESKIEIELDFTNEAIRKLRDYGSGYGNDNFFQNDMYHPCNAKITINGVTNQYYEVGARMKGNTSRDTSFVNNDGYFQYDHYCHFKLSFSQTFDKSEDNDYYINPWTNVALKKERKDRKFGGMKKIDLKWNRNFDNSFTKESYVQNAFINEGVLAQHSNLVLLTIKTENDTRSMVYQAYEAIDKQFLKQNYAGDNAGDLYKCLFTDMGPADLKDYSNNKIGVESQYYRPTYNLKTNEDTSNHELMKAFIDKLESTRGLSGSAFTSEISPLMDIDSFLKYSALCWTFGLPDDFRNNFNNYYIYFNKDNKAVFIVYDNDRCLGIRNGWDKDLSYQAWNDKHAMGYDTDNQSALIFRFISGGSNSSYPVDSLIQETYHQYCIEYANKYLNVNSFREFTNKFYYSNKDINNPGQSNDSFESYATAKLSTLN